MLTLDYIHRLKEFMNLCIILISELLFTGCFGSHNRNPMFETIQILN